MTVIEFLTAISPIILTAVATYIVIKQYILDKKRFQQEHFEEKYTIYKKTMNYISLIVANATTTSSEMIDFKKEANDVKIFFNEDIIKYIDEIYQKANRLRYLSKVTGNGQLPSEKHTILCEEEFTLISWFGEQFKVCEDLFIKYLKIN